LTDRQAQLASGEARGEVVFLHSCADHARAIGRHRSAGFGGRRNMVVAALAKG
jgi:hypothetical protein